MFSSSVVKLQQYSPQVPTLGTCGKHNRLRFQGSFFISKIKPCAIREVLHRSKYQNHHLVIYETVKHIHGMAIRFIPLFKAKAKSISRAQKSMGLYSSDSFVDKFKGAMRVFSALVTNSLENSVDTARSMKARGYGSAKRTSFSLFVFTVRDACMLVAVISFLILIFFCSSSGALQLVFYPEIAEVPCSPMAVGCYIAFVLLSLLPFIIEFTEDIKWKYYISKI